jgi:putative transcriptional regulator
MHNHVRQHRVRAGISQTDLGPQVGVSRQTVAALESGSYNPSVRLALRLAALFAVPVEELFHLEDCHQQATPAAQR